MNNCCDSRLQMCPEIQWALKHYLNDIWNRNKEIEIKLKVIKSYFFLLLCQTVEHYEEDIKIVLKGLQTKPSSTFRAHPNRPQVKIILGMDIHIQLSIRTSWNIS